MKDKMIDAALDLAASKSWSEISFEEIVEKAGVALDDAYEYFDDKDDVLAVYGRKIDRMMIENIGETSHDLSHREQIFDVLMERFDIVNDRREAVISIVSSFKGDPKKAVLSLPHLGRSMNRVLELCDISTEGFVGCARVTAVTGIYLYALRTWMEDDSADLAKTMATLDQALDKAEMVYNMLPVS